MPYMIVALIIWASSFSVGKYAYQSFDPALVVQFRLMVAALIALPIFIKHYQRIPKPLLRKVWLLALLNCPVVLMLQFLGLKYTSASTAVIVVGAEPVFILLTGYLLFQQKVAWYDWLLSLCAFIGIGLLVGGSNNSNDASLLGVGLLMAANDASLLGVGLLMAANDASLLGVGLLMAAAVSFALCIFLGKRVMTEITPTVFTAAILVIGTLLCVPFTLLFSENWQIDPNLPAIGAILYLGIACSWLAYWLWNKGLQVTPAHISGIMIALEPVFGVWIAILVLGERMNLIMAVGSAMVIAAALASTAIPIIKARQKTHAEH